MKILLIMPWIKQGGAELIAVQTAYQLQKLNHQVRLAALFVDTSQMGKEAKEIKNVTFGPKIANLFKKNKAFLYFFGPFFLFWLVLKEARWADILFPHSLPTYWLAPIIGKLYQKKVIWLCNEPPKRRRINEVNFSDWLMWFIADSFLDRLFVRGIDKIVVYSDGVAQEVRRRYGKRATVVRLGMDFNFFSKSNKEEVLKLKRKYNLEGKFILLMVGKLHPQKNQRLGIEVLKKILPKIPQAVLVLVGEGPDRKNLEFRISSFQLEDKVIFAGFCSPEVVRAWYAISDLVLFPSIGQTAMVSQSWGFVPFEALCQKKISITSQGCGAVEVLGKEKIGIICQPDVGDFSLATLSVFERRTRPPRSSRFCGESGAEEYKEMGERGYLYVKNNLSWEKWGREVERILGKVVRTRKIATYPFWRE